MKRHSGDNGINAEELIDRAIEIIGAEQALEKAAKEVKVRREGVKARYGSAGKAGFNVSVLKKVIKELRSGSDETQFEMMFEAEVNTYRRALRMVDGDVPLNTDEFFGVMKDRLKSAGWSQDDQGVWYQLDGDGQRVEIKIGE